MRRVASSDAPTATWQAVLLDLDGTLLDSLPDLAAAANAMRVDMALNPLPNAEIGTFVGKGVDVLVACALTGEINTPVPTNDARFKQARACFYEHYTVLNGQHATLFEGVMAGLDIFQSRGLKLGIVTNKPTVFTLPLLERTGLAPFIQTVICGDTCASRKPDPDPMLLACERLACKPPQTLVIGDSINDALSARAAGCQVLAVPYGYNEGQPVTDLPVDGIVQTLVVAAEWMDENQPTTTLHRPYSD